MAAPRFSRILTLRPASAAADPSISRNSPSSHVERAGAGDQHAARPEHLQGAQVQLLVAADGGFHDALGLGEGGRVEDDGVVLLAGGGVVLEQIEGIGLDPLDLAAGVRVAVELLVLLGDFQGGTRGIDCRHLAAHPGQVQGEASLVGEAVQGLAVGVAGSGGVVLALIEKGSRLLAAERVEVKADAVEGEDRCSTVRPESTAIRAPEAAPTGGCAGPRVRTGCSRENARPSPPSRRRRRSSRSNAWVSTCMDEHVVVFVDDQAGQQVGFAEDHAVGIGVAGELLAELHRAVDALAQKRQKLAFSDDLPTSAAGSRSARSCCRAPSRACRPRSSCTCTNAPGGDVAGLRQVGAIDPEMART